MVYYCFWQKVQDVLAVMVLFSVEQPTLSILASVQFHLVATVPIAASTVSWARPLLARSLGVRTSPGLASSLSLEPPWGNAWRPRHPCRPSGPWAQERGGFWAAQGSGAPEHGGPHAARAPASRLRAFLVLLRPFMFTFQFCIETPHSYMNKHTSPNHVYVTQVYFLWIRELVVWQASR